MSRSSRRFSFLTLLVAVDLSVAACTGAGIGDPGLQIGAGGSAFGTSGAASNPPTSGGAPGYSGGGNGGAPVVGGASSAGMSSVPPLPTAIVTFSVPSGTFTAPFDVSISTTVAGGEIRYTKDRTAPSPTSTLYTGAPIHVTTTTQLVANVYQGGVAVGRAESVNYVARSAEITSDLPLIVIDTYGSGEPGEINMVDSSLMVFQPKPTDASVGVQPDVAMRAAIRVRGQTSSEFAKKPYRVELRNELSADQDHALLGMPADSDWVLHGPFADKALIQNPFIYSLGPDIGLKAPRWAFTELYLNTRNAPLAASDYRGLYVLVETIKNSKNRLDLSQLRATDTLLPAITGGYIFKFEYEVAEQPILSCVSLGRNIPCFRDLEVHDPEPLIPEQQAWLTTHVQAFHAALMGESFGDATLGYAAYIDVESFVNYMLLSEFTRNLDAYIRSLYLYKDRVGKITVGPLWDYNLIAGSGLRTSNTSTEGFQYLVTRNGEANGWFQRLIQDPAFKARLVSRYRELRQGPLSDAQIDARIDLLTAPLARAAERNFMKWPNLTEATIVFFDTPTANSWRGQVDAMRTWLKQRAAWLDTQF